MRAAVLTILLFAALKAGAESNLPTIEIQSEVYATPGTPLLLGAMAKVDGLSLVERNQIKNILVLEGFNGGESKVLSNLVLSETLRREIPKFTKKRVELKIPSRVRILVREQQFEVSGLVDQLQERAKQICPECRFVVSNVKIVGVALTTDLSAYRLPRIVQLPKGNFIYHLVGPSGEANAKVTGEMRTYLKVAVLTRSVAASQKFQTGDVKWEERDVTFSLEGVPKEDEWIKREAKQNLVANQILWSRHLERIRGTQRNQSVRALLGEENWQVTITAIAMDGGFIGDVVRVMNPATKRIFSGELIQEGVVRVQQ